MAKVKLNKKMGELGLKVPECPVCMEALSAPIFSCPSGHSLCGRCYNSLCPAICPVCRLPMDHIRSRALENIIAEAKVACPNKANGCVYILTRQDVDNHLKECIFRDLACPIGAVFGKCSWQGKFQDMYKHVKERHPENCNISTDSDIELNNISVTVDDRYLFLVEQGKLLFLLTVKIDTNNKMGSWIVQHIGSKNIAKQHVYEIHIRAKHDNRRKAMFSDYCFNDVMKPEDIFHQGKCGIMPLSMLSHFIGDKKIVFRLNIRRIPANPNQKFEKGEHTRVPRAGPSGSSAKGKGPNWRSQSSHGARSKSPGLKDRNANPSDHSRVKSLFDNHPFNYKN